MNFVKMARKIFEVTDVGDDPDKKVWSREGIHLYVYYIDNADMRRELTTHLGLRSDARFRL